MLELWKRVQDQWDKIDKTQCLKLVESTPNRDDFPNVWKKSSYLTYLRMTRDKDIEIDIDIWGAPFLW